MVCIPGLLSSSGLFDRERVCRLKNTKQLTEKAIELLDRYLQRIVLYVTIHIKRKEQTFNRYEHY